MGRAVILGWENVFHFFCGPNSFAKKMKCKICHTHIPFELLIVVCIHIHHHQHRQHHQRCERSIVRTKMRDFWLVDKSTKRKLHAPLQLVNDKQYIRRRESIVVYAVCTGKKLSTRMHVISLVVCVCVVSMGKTWYFLLSSYRCVLFPIAWMVQLDPWTMRIILLLMFIATIYIKFFFLYCWRTDRQRVYQQTVINLFLHRIENGWLVLFAWGGGEEWQDI